jgi:serine/threonine protein kinase
MVNWKENNYPFKKFTEELTQEWMKHGFNKKETRDWLENGLQPSDANFAKWLRDIEVVSAEKFLNESDEQTLREKYAKYLRKQLDTNKWKNIHPDFTEELQKEWEEKGFSYEQSKEWINVGLQPSGAGYAQWLKNTKEIKAERFLSENNDEDLQKQYNEYNLTNALDKTTELFNSYFKDYFEELPKAIIENRLGDYSCNFLSKMIENKIMNEEQALGILQNMQKSMIERDETIINPGLSSIAIDPLKNLLYNFDRFFPESDESKYRLCKECHKPNTGKDPFCEGWCRSCNARHFQQDFDKWTSGNFEIDGLIQKYQLEATNPDKLLEWIPYERFTNIDYLAEGGFGTVYRAEWIDRPIESWDIKERNWKRKKREVQHGRGCDCAFCNYGLVALKVLKNSQGMNSDFLQEIILHKKIDNTIRIVKCYGISQDPETRNYVMVMQYMTDGDLRQYLRNCGNVSYYELKQLITYMAEGLNWIHEQDLVHKDFHPGNIFVSSLTCAISDLGLCRPVDYQKEESEIYGVLPYVAPEVLRSKSYTKASDIYSFGIVMYEMLSGKPPYFDLDNDEFLDIKICQGLRPNLNNVKAPQLVKDLIKKCLDADPFVRPTANELWITLCNESGGEFDITNQFRRILSSSSDINTKMSSKKNNQILLESKKNSSRLLDFKNLPEPQNSKEINEQFYSDSLTFDFTKLDLHRWEEIRPDFTDELIHQWQSHNFTLQQCKEWLDAGLKSTDASFCAWLRDIKKLTPEEALNNGNLEQLNQEFFNWWQEETVAQTEQPPK